MELALKYEMAQVFEKRLKMWEMTQIKCGKWLKYVGK